MKKSIRRNLAYFDVFQHPLKKAELVNVRCSDEVNETLRELLHQQKCFQHNGQYSIQPKVKELVEERRIKEKRARHYFKKLPFYVKLIKCFPFVRGVAISGSLSKGVMHEDGDIDYFIITTKNRLWICRSLLILFKKIFLLNSRKYFCINYLIDEENLEIIDKNMFTAVEVSYLLPVYNLSLIEKIKMENSWSKQFFAISKNKQEVECFEGNNVFKSLMEKIINFLPADRLDLFFMQLTFKRWNKKFKHFNSKKLELTMRSNRGVSKHHPKDFQTKVLAEYEKRLQKLKLDNEDTVNA